MATQSPKSELQIKTDKAQEEVRALKKEIDKLKKTLDDTSISNSKYVKTQNKLIDTEKKHEDALKTKNALLKQNTVDHKNSVNAIQQRINALRQEMNAMDMNSPQFKQRSADMRQLTASMLQGSSATGLHAASAMELGRVFSDAPYGIRGVANNISQLSSLMAQAATTTDAATGKAIGLGGAFKGLWKSLMGPLGILLAVQTAIAALEFFNNTAKDVDSTLSKLGQEGVTTMTTKLNLLVKITNDSTIALETKRETVRRANEEIKDLNAEIDENGNLTLASAENIHAMSTELMKMAKAAAAVEMIKELNKEIVKISLSQGETYFSFAKIIGLEDNDAIIKKQKDDAIAKIEKDIKDIISIGKDQDFIPQIFGGDDPKGGGRSKALKEFKGRIFDLQKYILGLNKETVLSQERNVMKRLKIEQGYAKAELDLKLKLFVDKQRQRRDDFIKNAKTQEEIDKANRTFDDMEFQAEGEHSMAMGALKLKNTAETAALEREIREQAAIDSQAAELERVAAHLELLAGLIDENDPNSLASLQEKQREVWAIEDEAFAIDQERKRQKLQDADYTEQEINQILHDEKMARDSVRKGEEVDLEIATIEAKKKAQLEYVGWVASIGSTMKKLSKDNEGLAKAALLVEKGAATAKVIIETQKSNAAITALAGARTMAGDPVAAKQGKILKLKNNIGAGLAIANIWATSTASRSNPDGGSGSGGGGNTFNPNFNVVGNSETNQLAESIGGQVNQPNRAYVVYEDIENATELNANAVESSGI